MYSTDLTKIKLDEFVKHLRSIQLLPSQKVLLNDIDLNFKKLAEMGMSNLAEIHKLLKNKTNQSILSQKLDIAPEYLNILQRVINSYEVKSMSIDKIGVFTETELNILKNKKISTTQNYYEYFIKNPSVDGISTNKLKYALQIIDLLRINGVGIEYARILYEIGIKSVADYKNTKSEAILEQFKDANVKKKLTKSNLGFNDIEYCRRFCDKLDSEI